MHYIRVQEGPAVNPALIKTRPRISGPRLPVSMPPTGMAMPGIPPAMPMGVPGMQVPPGMTPQQVQQLNLRYEQQRKLHKLRQQPPSQPSKLMEEERDPSGGYLY